MVRAGRGKLQGMEGPKRRNFFLPGEKEVGESFLEEKQNKIQLILEVRQRMFQTEAAAWAEA